MENKTTPINIDQLRTELNKLRMMKGQVAHIATCNRNGQPNLAPIGSMRITDDGTVHVIQGFLNKTYGNLKQNPKAAFSFFQIPGLTSFKDFFRDNEEEILGYRVYCDFIEVLKNEAAIAEESTQILKRFPWYLRKPFAKFAKKNFKRVLVFKITDIRATK